MITITPDLIKKINYIIVNTHYTSVNINGLLYNFDDLIELYININNLIYQQDYYKLEIHTNGRSFMRSKLLYVKVDNLHSYENLILLFKDDTHIQLSNDAYTLLLKVIRKHKLDYIKNNI